MRYSFINENPCCVQAWSGCVLPRFISTGTGRTCSLRSEVRRSHNRFPAGGVAFLRSPPATANICVLLLTYHVANYWILSPSHVSPFLPPIFGSKWNAWTRVAGTPKTRTNNVSHFPPDAANAHNRTLEHIARGYRGFPVTLLQRLLRASLWTFRGRACRAPEPESGPQTNFSRAQRGDGNTAGPRVLVHTGGLPLQSQLGLPAAATAAYDVVFQAVSISSISWADGRGIVGLSASSQQLLLYVAWAHSPPPPVPRE